MGTLETAEHALEAVQQLNARDYARYDYDAQCRALEDLKATVGHLTSVLAALDRLIIAHRLSPEHLEAVAAEEYKDSLTRHKTDLSRQAGMLQSLLKSMQT